MSIGHKAGSFRRPHSQYYTAFLPFSHIWYLKKLIKLEKGGRKHSGHDDWIIVGNSNELLQYQTARILYIKHDMYVRSNVNPSVIILVGKRPCATNKDVFITNINIINILILRQIMTLR